MTQVLVFVLIVLASYRVWRLLARDAFPPVQVPRDWVLGHTPDWVGTMLGCGWCAGSWVTLATTWVVSACVSVEAPVLVGVAASAVVGFVAQYDVAD